MDNVIDTAFTESVKSIQTRKGSRAGYQSMADQQSWTDTLREDHVTFIAEQRSLYFSTVNASGQPYTQHRGGPPGFLNVIDDRTLAFADFKGNRQYISQGNLQDNNKAFMFLMNYSNQSRLKIWGEAHVIENDPHMIEQLMPKGYKARPEQAIFFRISLLEYNCKQHIPIRFDAEHVAIAIEKRDQKIKELEAEVARLKNQ